MKKFTIIGLDIGSASVTLVQLDQDRSLIAQAYAYHNGKVAETILKIQKNFDLSNVIGICSPSEKEWFGKRTDKVHLYDSQTCLITATKHYYPDFDSILLVGAERYQRLIFDKKGNYSHTLTNSSCAAGTGSFLDQQAERLGLSGAYELSTIAQNNKDDLPEIASRCSVFAKTDLIHAQQAGFSRSAICDSLCRGLSRNIVDTLFSDEKPEKQVIFAGGVSNNRSVQKHIEDLIGTSLIVHDYAVYFSAIGSCLLFLNEKNSGLKSGKINIGAMLAKHKQERNYFHEPLSLKLSDYPDFTSDDTYRFSSLRANHTSSIEVDIYENIRRSQVSVYMGIDIGSTSTKAILTNKEGMPLAGFYTYTEGQPLRAVQAIFESIVDFSTKRKIKLSFLGLGTTGSGRKFIGKIVGADVVVDEITTHARAAFQLDPSTDTIIEIGGQDAKFTLMREGLVTFSQMNSVCAAGTGSFIEEQALKLEVPLASYSRRSEGSRAPLASDRCTVFMERDLNQYLNRGYAVNEVLASVLHSVCENYLKKVAVESSIGNHVCFQGATARNRALVAVFEQKLGKPIYVSKYCHLTGALGTALILKDEGVTKSSLKGLDIYRLTIPLATEICSYCNNHCRISVADLKGEKVAYGFLCGRDYDTSKYVERNTSGFNLLKERKNVFAIPKITNPVDKPIIGIPAALHLFDEVSLWKKIFMELGFRVITSEKSGHPLAQGKRLARAEFCSPMYALHGHVMWLSERCDHIFLPVYLEARNKSDEEEANYCYYTQFAPSVITLANTKIQKMIIHPFLNYSSGDVQVTKSLYQEIRQKTGKNILLKDVKRIYLEAIDWHQSKKKKLKTLYLEELKQARDISVVLVGRPYLALDPTLNKNIPELLAGMGIKTFFQDMIPYEREDIMDIDYLLKTFPWYYGSRILEVARVISKTDHVYPVFITAFKCAPDSFALEYFKKLMDSKGKPYLILQMDEHDSNVGYETRIEAGVRAFRNHALSGKKIKKVKSPLITLPIRNINSGKTILFPKWDGFSGRLVVANLRRAGFDVHLLEMSDLSIRKSMARNSGQCLPLNIIAQDTIDYIEKYHLDPAKTILWMVETQLTCNIRMYPYFIKTLLNAHGQGMEKVSVYSGELAHTEISINTTYYANFAYMFSGLLRRLGCRIRPYEYHPGETDKAVVESLDLLENAFLGKTTLEEGLRESMNLFHSIQYDKQTRKPQAAIFGDFFVRDNDVLNQGLFNTIEMAGGEVINTPYNDYVKITIENILRRRAAKGQNLEVLGYRALLKGIKLIEKRYYKYFEPFLGPSPRINPIQLEKNLKAFHVNKMLSGESYDNILKIFHIIEHYPGVDLFVQTSPAFCCPSLITEAMKDKIRELTGKPVVNITYDGTSEQKNDIVIPYLKVLSSRKKKAPVSKSKVTEKDLLRRVLKLNHPLKL